MLNADVPAEREPAADHAELWFTRQMVLIKALWAGKTDIEVEEVMFRHVLSMNLAYLGCP